MVLFLSKIVFHSWYVSRGLLGNKRLVGFKNVYRICIGNYRAFFVFHMELVDDSVFFEYLISRVEAYGKKMQEQLRIRDS